MKQEIKDLTGFIIDAKFSSHEEMAKMSELWDIELTQTEDGTFQGFINGIHTPHIQIAHSYQSHGVIVKGKIPANTYLFANIKGSGECSNHGIPLTADEIMVLDDHHEINFTSKSSFFDITIVVEKTFFEDTYKMMYGRPFLYNKDNRRIKLKNTNKSNFKVDIEKWIKFLIKHKEDWLHNPALTADIEKDIIETLCDYFEDYREVKLLTSEKDALALQQYIDKNYTEDITIKEICDVLKISERSVRPSFKKIFGYNPKEYLSRYRLGRFRNALIKDANNQACISDKCYEQGIFHPGRLPNEYKKMFGYLPSDMSFNEHVDD